jgi:hypothetical protein
MGQSFLCESFSSKTEKRRRKNETINQNPSTSIDCMRNNPDQKIVNLMDLNDYVVLYVLENHLRITTD